MNKVTVYCWTIWDSIAGRTRPGRRKGTAEAIKLAQGKIQEDTAEEIDESLLDENGFVRG